MTWSEEGKNVTVEEKQCAFQFIVAGSLHFPGRVVQANACSDSHSHPGPSPDTDPGSSGDQGGCAFG